MVFEVSKEFLSNVDPDKVYYCFLIKFNRNFGFTRKIAPTPCYLSKLNDSCYMLYSDKDKSDRLGDCTDYRVYTQFSGVYETFEECVLEYNKILKTKIDAIELDYKNKVEKLTKNIILL